MSKVLSSLMETVSDQLPAFPAPTAVSVSVDTHTQLLLNMEIKQAAVSVIKINCVNSQKSHNNSTLRSGQGNLRLFNNLLPWYSARPHIWTTTSLLSHQSLKSSTIFSFKGHQMVTLLIIWFTTETRKMLHLFVGILVRGSEEMSMETDSLNSN